MNDLMNFLKNEKGARKIFGKRELKIIEKQFLGVNLTQSEKNRLSRDIRVKLNFIEKISKFSNEFSLKKASKINKLIEESQEIILQDMVSKNISEIILFGSFIENKLTLKSDIDIAVKFRSITSKDAMLFRKRISGKVNSKIDVLVYNFLPQKVKREIDLNAKRLFIR